MSIIREYRQVVVTDLEVRAKGKTGIVVADVLRYGVVDDYRTVFVPGVFTESLATRMPRICWAHDWSDPLGRWTDHEDTREKLRLFGQLDLGLDVTGRPAVPSAHRALAQLESGTIDQFSVGFMRQADGPIEGMPGVTAIRKATLDEASPVLVGAVPGTALVDVRSGRRVMTRGRLPLFPR